MTYTLSIGVALGSSNTGLTIAAQLVDTVGANVGGAVASGFVELGGGNYGWTYASYPDGFRGFVKVTTGSITVAVPINPQEAENLDAKVSSLAASLATLTAYVDTEVAAIKAKTDTLGAATVTVTSPVAASGDVEIIRGDDYSNLDGRALEWTNAAGTWPDLTGATITFTAEQSGKAITKAGTVIVPTGAAQKVRVELTAAETIIAAGTWSFDVQAALATNGRIVTLLFGSLTVRADVTTTS